jgi:hypothetical protein
LHRFRSCDPSASRFRHGVPAKFWLKSTTVLAKKHKCRRLAEPVRPRRLGHRQKQPDATSLVRTIHIIRT